jgi:exodeoxyribonuclease V alpha subunit
MLNPGGADQPAVGRFGSTYRLGDKVMQIVNDYEKDVFNGDIGFVTALDPEANEITMDFDGRPVV